MALNNIKIPEKSIKVGEGSITVRGVSLSDLMTVVNVYGPQATVAFQRLQQTGSLESSDVRLMIGTLAEEFPDMVAALMALAADEYNPDSINTLKKLNFQIQFEVIEAIFELTFPNEGDVKKLIESLSKKLTEVSGALAGIRSPSPIGTGASAVQ